MRATIYTVGEEQNLKDWRFHISIHASLGKILIRERLNIQRDRFHPRNPPPHSPRRRLSIVLRAIEVVVIIVVVHKIVLSIENRVAG